MDKNVKQQLVDLIKDFDVDTQHQNYKTQHQQKIEFGKNGGKLSNFEEAGKARSINWGCEGSVKNFKNHTYELVRELKDDNPNYRNLQQLPKFVEQIKNHLNEKLDTASFAHANNLASNYNKLADMCGEKFKMEEQFGKIRDAIAEWRSECRELGYSKDMNLEPRSYNDCISIGEKFSRERHAVAWDLMYEGGMRINCEANGRGDGIQADQLKGYADHPITGQKCGVIEVEGKGHRNRSVYVPVNTYQKLENIIQHDRCFKFDSHKFRDDLKEACNLAGEEYNGPHGARHSFAKEYMGKCLNTGMDYKSALKYTSFALGHSRESVTLIYLR